MPWGQFRRAPVAARARRIVFAVLSLAATMGPALACGSDVLGTARILVVNSGGGPRFGTRQYAATLPLGDREVVLTFDDGPSASTAQVLSALTRECVRATFFLIGRNAAAHPELVRRIAREGHTVANHSWSHPWTMRNLPFATALANIEHGRDAIDRALAGSGVAQAPFFRFPGFADTPALLAALADRDVSIWGADLWASDWVPMTAMAQLALVLARLERQRGGIVLFHDTQPQTAAMIGPFLRALKERGFRVVHATAPAVVATR